MSNPAALLPDYPPGFSKSSTNSPTTCGPKPVLHALLRRGLAPQKSCNNPLHNFREDTSPCCSTKLTDAGDRNWYAAQAADHGAPPGGGELHLRHPARPDPRTGPHRQRTRHRGRGITPSPRLARPANSATTRSVRCGGRTPDSCPWPSPRSSSHRRIKAGSSPARVDAADQRPPPPQRVQLTATTCSWG